MNQRSLLAASLFAVALLALLPARPALADPPLAAEYWVTCKPVESMIFLGVRFHVKCDQGWTNPSTNHEYRYFAISTSSSTQVEQAISMAQAAQTSGKRVKLRIKSSSSSNPAGCQTDDCRAFVAIGVVD